MTEQIGDEEAQRSITQHVREIEILCDQFGYDPNEWLADPDSPVLAAPVISPSPEQIDALALELYSMGVHVPPRDTAFFQAAVRKWLDSLNPKGGE